MCGINGFNWPDKNLVKKMNKATKHRGPDQEGYFIDENISLGHNRLSIIDLSKNGKQPMFNEDGSICIIFNGEIYNFKELRSYLEKKGHDFISKTDTEVIIHSYEEYGKKCVNHFNGMFTFAIWDSNINELFIARDRIGIKPLYYFFDGEKFIFSSEIKAILLHDIKKNINFEALCSFFTYRCITGENTIFEGIKKLNPGNILLMKGKNISIKKYWKFPSEIIKAGEDYYIKGIKTLLDDSVSKRLVSDVPIAVFLSGGLDSSTIAAIANNENRKIMTFSIGYEEDPGETTKARKVAEYLGTNHKEITLSYEAMMKEFPNIIWHLDEPLADLATMPFFYASKKIKKFATVALLGEGSDELFAGYEEYKIMSPYFFFIPKFLKRIAFSYLRRPFKKGSPLKIYKYFNIGYNGRLEDTLRADIKYILPNFQLLRVDKLSMASSVEARVPFLDYRLVEFAQKIPAIYKLNGFREKYILKKTVKEYLPETTIKTKKKGFFVPINLWVDEILNDLDIKVFNNSGLFDSNFIKKTLDKKGKFRYDYQIWMLYMFQKWYEKFMIET